MNVIEIRLEKKHPLDAEGRPYPKTYCVFATYIDGKPIANFDHAATDINVLIDSCTVSEEQFVLKCWCGDAGCAGYFQGIKVRHDEGRIYWDRDFIFDRTQYQAAVRDSLERAKDLIAQWKNQGDELDLVGYIPGAPQNDRLLADLGLSYPSDTP